MTSKQYLAKYISLIFIGKMAFLADVEVARSNVKWAASKVRPRAA
ncbi:MAG: hypothetical protein ABI606_17115 [Rhodoferax sp.]